MSEDKAQDGQSRSVRDAVSAFFTEINAESDEWQNMLNDGKWYNLTGVRVQTPTKGVFIHEGKKYVVKESVERQ